MSIVRIVLVAIASWMFPAFGLSFAGRGRAALGWLAALLATALATAISVWILPLILVVQLASVVAGVRAVRANDRAGGRSHWGAALLIALLGIMVFGGLRASVLPVFKIPSSSMAPTLAVGDHIWVDKLSIHARAIAPGDVVVFRHPCQPDRDYIKRVIALAGQTVEVRCNTTYVDGKPLAEQLVTGGDRCTYDDSDDRGDVDTRWYTRACSAYTESSGSRTYHTFHDPERPERAAHPATLTTGDVHDFPRLERPQPPSCASSETGRGVAVANQQPGTLVATRPGAGPCEPQLHYVVPAGHFFVLGDNRSNSNDSRYWGAVPLENLTGFVRGIWLSDGPSGSTLRRFGGID